MYLNTNLLKTKVQKRGYVLINNYIQKEQIKKLNKLLFSYYKKKKIRKNFNYKDNHIILHHGVSKFQNTKHHYISFKMYNLKKKTKLINKFNQILKKILIIQKKMIKYNLIKQLGYNIFPEIIYYENNKGFLNDHVHLLHPQRYGYVLGLTDEEDKESGHYQKNLKVPINCGDLLIFKISNHHSVKKNTTKRKQNVDYDFRGRLVLVTPILNINS